MYDGGRRSSRDLEGSHSSLVGSSLGGAGPPPPPGPPPPGLPSSPPGSLLPPPPSGSSTSQNSQPLSPPSNIMDPMASLHRHHHHMNQCNSEADDEELTESYTGGPPSHHRGSPPPPPQGQFSSLGRRHPPGPPQRPPGLHGHPTPPPHGGHGGLPPIHSMPPPLMGTSSSMTRHSSQLIMSSLNDIAGAAISSDAEMQVRRSASGVLRCSASHDEDDEDVEDDLDDLDNYRRHSGRNHPPSLSSGRKKSILDDYDDEDDFHPDDMVDPRCPYQKDPFDGLQFQMSMMDKSINEKMAVLHGYYHGQQQTIDTTAALSEIRSQLHELTRSLENCQSDVFDVKQDMMSIKHEIDSVQFVKEEIDDLRDSLDRIECEGDRRKAKLLEHGLTFYLGFCIFTAVLGMLQFGYNTGVINAPESVIEKFIRYAYRQRTGGKNMTYEASTFLYAIAVSIFALGGMCGGFFGGWIANKFGRKGGLLLNNILGITASASMGLAKFVVSFELLIIGRFLIGVNCGINTSLVPMYISEISPLTLRGGLGTVNQLAVTVGLLISQVLGIEGLLGTDEGWPFLLGIAFFPSALQLALLPMCPESPRYSLISKQQEKVARDALKKLRNSKDIEDDIEEMKAEELAQKAEAKIGLCELLRSPSLRLPLLIAVVMQLSQQLSGINAVFYYSTNLFIITGLSESNAKFATIGIGCVMVIMTLISIPLMDRSGRRTLHLYGLGGMFTFSIFITISFLVKELVAWIWWLSVVSTLFYVVFFAVGPGSIPWMITAELFSQGPRPAAMSVAVLINWCANFLVGIGFPTMQTALENYTFLPFSVFLAIFWVFTYKKVPETKNRTFEEIAALFRNGKKGKKKNLMNVNSIPSINSTNTCEHKPMIPAPTPTASNGQQQQLQHQISMATTTSTPGQTTNGTGTGTHTPAERRDKSMNGKPMNGSGILSNSEYPPLMGSFPSSPSRSKSPSQLSEYSFPLRNSSSQILSPNHSDISREDGDVSGSVTAATVAANGRVIGGGSGSLHRRHESGGGGGGGQGMDHQRNSSGSMRSRRRGSSGGMHSSSLERGGPGMLSGDGGMSSSDTNGPPPPIPPHHLR